MQLKRNKVLNALESNSLSAIIVQTEKRIMRVVPVMLLLFGAYQELIYADLRELRASSAYTISKIIRGVSVVHTREAKIKKMIALK